jgi:3-keto-disaccharide hydrolase
MKAHFSLILALTATTAFAADQDKDFKPLFNGKDTTGWHVRREKANNAWKVEGGILKNDLKPGEHGVDLVADQKFWNFTARYEYQVPAGSNSGFYLRGRHEIQILGDFKKGEPTKTGDGAIYNFKVPDVYASDREGGWNTVEATIIDHKITVTINGKKVQDNVECAVATGSEIDKNVNEPGPIFLQGDHGAVSFRKIEIKVLPGEPPGK